MAGPSISQQKILAASRGDSASLLEVLQAMAQTTTQQQAATGTTPIASPTPGQPNPAAPVPAQATGSVSLLSGNYIVQLVNPGASSPISTLQAQEAKGNFSPLTPLQPVQTIYHQIRASTSPAFNVNSNTQVFGGNTGSAQVYWTITGLGSGTWYFQFRSSFDGINFNKWKNANSGTALGGLINQVTLENAGNSLWALFTLPGSLVMGIGAALVVDQEIFELATQVYSSGMVAIAGPNGYQVNTLGETFGVTACDVDLQTPSSPVAGIPDYPVEIRMTYGQRSGAAPLSGSASVFAIAFDPTNPNVTLHTSSTGTWAVMRLPGGARVAFGQGVNVDGANIYTPPVSWFNASRMMSICSLTAAVDTGNGPHGYWENQLSGTTMQAEYSDQDSASNIWGTTANWMAIAWEEGADVTMVGGFPFLRIQLQGGHAVVIGAGQVASGTPVALPAGFNSTDMLSICTPAQYDLPEPHVMSGILQCGMIGLVPTLLYANPSVLTWTGNVNWLLAAWI
jgi:hypothetical protein